jgi:hypothetical protein
MLLRHKRCGAQTRAEVVCSQCREPLEAADLAIELGPGFLRSESMRRRMRERLAGS